MVSADGLDCLAVVEPHLEQGLQRGVEALVLFVDPCLGKLLQPSQGRLKLFAQLVHGQGASLRDVGAAAGLDVL